MGGRALLAALAARVDKSLALMNIVSSGYLTVKLARRGGELAG